MSGNINGSAERGPFLERLGHATAIYFALFLCAIILGGGGLAAIIGWLSVGHHLKLNCILSATFILVGPLEYLSLRFLGERLEHGTGLVELALEQPDSGIAMRPLV